MLVMQTISEREAGAGDLQGDDSSPGGRKWEWGLQCQGEAKRGGLALPHQVLNCPCLPRPPAPQKLHIRP